ncbi:hypothetical protein Scep_004043 [Stephania cephalantha]|uniref:Uncharacterized protein n=1 Tax=Stephania cephalantha TaxID=152367 RepID=A0AAP0KUI5_9MAGN
MVRDGIETEIFELLSVGARAFCRHCRISPLRRLLCLSPSSALYLVVVVCSVSLCRLLCPSPSSPLFTAAIVLGFEIRSPVFDIEAKKEVEDEITNENDDELAKRLNKQMRKAVAAARGRRRALSARNSALVRRRISKVEFLKSRKGAVKLKTDTSDMPPTAKLQRRRQELTQTIPDQPVDDEALYYKVAGECPKGRVYGLGSLGRKKRRYADPGASTSQVLAQRGMSNFMILITPKELLEGVQGMEQVLLLFSV